MPVGEEVRAKQTQAPHCIVSGSFSSRPMLSLPDGEDFIDTEINFSMEL